MTERLQPKDLQPGSLPVNRVIDKAVEEFEYKTKRRLDITMSERSRDSVQVPGIVNNTVKRFNQNKLFLSKYVCTISTMNAKLTLEFEA